VFWSILYKGVGASFFCKYVRQNRIFSMEAKIIILQLTKGYKGKIWNTNLSFFMLVSYENCPSLLSGSLLILLLFRSIHTPKQWTVAKVPKTKTLEQNPILHLIKVVDISWSVHNVCGNRLCFCWNAKTFDLDPLFEP